MTVAGVCLQDSIWDGSEIINHALLYTLLGAFVKVSILEFVRSQKYRSLKIPAIRYSSEPLTVSYFHACINSTIGFVLAY